MKYYCSKTIALAGSVLARRWVFVLLPLAIAVLSLLSYHAAYQTMDDLAMRIALDGTAFEYGGKRMPYVVYMSPLYGYILTFLYSLAPCISWYDVFLYLFIGAGALASQFMVSLGMWVPMSDWERLACGTVVAAFTAAFMILPQFTIASGCLAGSSALAMVCLLENKAKGQKSPPWLFAYAYLAAAFSSLIRFECFLLVFAFAILVLAPRWCRFLDKSTLRKAWRTVVACCGVLALVLSLKVIGDAVVSDNREWREISEFNKFRVEVTDKTDMWDDVSTPWHSVEVPAVKETLDECDYSLGDYRLLLSFFLSGNREKNNSETLKLVAGKVAAFVQGNNHRFRFRIKDYSRIFTPLVVAFVGICSILLVICRKRLWALVFVGASFYLCISALNMFFRALPERLWVNLAFFAFMAAFATPRNGSWAGGRRQAGALLCLLFAVASALVVYVGNTGKVTAWIRDGYKGIRDNLKSPAFAKNDKVYFVDYATSERLGRPFMPYLPKRYGCNMILSSFPLVASRETDIQLQKFGISPTNTILDITKRDSRARFLLTAHTYMQPFEATMKAIGFYLGQKGFPAVAYFKPIEGSMTYEVKVVREYPKMLEEWEAHCSAIKPECDGRFNWDVELGRFLSTHMHGCTVQQIQDVASRLRSCVVIDDNYKVN